MGQLLKHVAFVEAGNDAVAQALSKKQLRAGKAFSKKLDDGSYYIFSEKRIFEPNTGADKVVIGEVTWKN